MKGINCLIFHSLSLFLSLVAIIIIYIVEICCSNIYIYLFVRLDFNTNLNSTEIDDLKN